MVSFRILVSYMVPVTAVFSLLWLFARRKPKKIIYRKPDSKSELAAESPGQDAESVDDSSGGSCRDEAAVGAEPGDVAVVPPVSFSVTPPPSDSSQHSRISGSDVVVNGHGGNLIRNIQNHKKESRQEISAPASGHLDCSEDSPRLPSQHACPSSQIGDSLVSKDSLSQEDTVNSHNCMNVLERNTAGSALPGIAENSQQTDQEIGVVEEMVVRKSADLTAAPAPDDCSRAWPNGAASSPASESPKPAIGTALPDDATSADDELNEQNRSASSSISDEKPAKSVLLMSKVDVNSVEKSSHTASLTDAEKFVVNPQSLSSGEELVTATSFKPVLAENQNLSMKPSQTNSIPSHPEQSVFDVEMECIEDGESHFAVKDENASTPIVSRGMAKSVDKTMETSMSVDKAMETSKSVDKTMAVSKSVDKTMETSKSVDKTMATSKSVHENPKTSKSVDENPKASKSVDKTTKTSKSVDKTTKTSKSVDKTTKTSKPVDKTMETSKPVDKTTKTSKPVDKTHEKCSCCGADNHHPCDADCLIQSSVADKASISQSSTPGKGEHAKDSSSELMGGSGPALAVILSHDADQQNGNQTPNGEVKRGSSDVGDAEAVAAAAAAGCKEVETAIVMNGEDGGSTKEVAKTDATDEKHLQPLTVSTSEVNSSGDQTQTSPVTNAESPSIDSNSVGSNDSGRGGSVAETTPMIPMAHYEFYFPTTLCGRLIGKQGRNIKFIKEKSGANLALKDNPYRADVQICIVEGSSQEVQKALELVRRKFPKTQYPDVDISAINMPQGMPVLIPRTMQVTLPACVNTEVTVSGILDAGHLFVQIPGNPTFQCLAELEQFMTSVYSQNPSIPWLPRPVEPNVICAAPWNDRWYRVQVGRVIDEKECEVMYLDHGYYDVAMINQLRQIRQDFMAVPFQAIECYMGNISPLNGEDCFSQAATDLLSEMTTGQLMQAQIVGTAEDGCPYIHLRASSQENGIDKVKFINLELVSQNVVQWVEILPGNM